MIHFRHKFGVFALIASLWSASAFAGDLTTILDCIRLLHAVDTVNRHYETSDFPVLPYKIYADVFRKILAETHLSDSETQQLKEVFEKQRKIDLTMDAINSYVGGILLGRFDGSQPKIPSEAEGVFTQKEIDELVQQRITAIRDNPNRNWNDELNSRSGQSIWYAYLLLPGAAQQFPEFLDHISNSRLVHIPGSLMHLTQESPTFKAFITYGLKNGKLSPNSGPVSDAFHPEGLAGNIDKVSIFTKDTAVFLDLIKHLSAELKTVKVGISPDYHKLKIKMIADILDWTLKENEAKVLSDPNWNASWNQALETAIPAILERENIGTSDYPQDAKWYNSNQIEPNTRPIFLNAIFKSRLALKSKPWQDWYISLLGVDRIQKLLVDEGNAIKKNLEIEKMPDLPGTVKVLDSTVKFAIESWSYFLSSRGQLNNVLTHPYPDDLRGFRSRILDELRKVPTAFPDIFMYGDEG